MMMMMSRLRHIYISKALPFSELQRGSELSTVPTRGIEEKMMKEQELRKKSKSFNRNRTQQLLQESLLRLLQ